MEANTRILELRRLISEYDHQYYVLNSPTIGDDEYDQMYQELVALERQFPELADSHSPTQRVGGGMLSKGFTKVKHRVKMLSLDNIRSAADVLKRLGVGKEVLIEPKIDGLSLKLVYKNGRLERAITRGNGDEGDDVTLNARAISTVPLVLQEPVSIEVLGEVYMTYDAFNELNTALEAEEEEPMANVRNAAGGALKLKDPAEVAKRRLSFVAYGSHTHIAGVDTQYTLTELLETYGFKSTWMLPYLHGGKPVTALVTIESEAQVAKLLKELDERRKLLNLQTDGLVFKINSLDEQHDLGEGNKYPNWAFAFKYPPERKPTTLLAVTIQVGKTGKITPVAELKPVLLSGTTVQRASLSNQDEIHRLNVNVGDEVFIEKAAEIIPNVVGVATKNTDGYFRIPSTCPSCNSKLQKPEGMVDSYCTNPECKEVVSARLRYALSKKALDMQGCGKGLVAELIRHGIKRVSDVLTVDKAKLDFIKPAARRNFIEQRELIKTRPFWRQLAALSIDGLGETKCQELAAAFPSLYKVLGILDREETVQEREEREARIRAILGPALYKTFFFWLSDDANVDEIDRLNQAGMTFVSADGEGEGRLSGKVFVITGTMMSGDRDEVAERIRKAGGIVKSQATRKTNFIVQGVGGGRVKAEAAEKLGIPLISEEKLFEMIGEPMPTVEVSNLEALRDE